MITSHPSVVGFCWGARAPFHSLPRVRRHVSRRAPLVFFSLALLQVRRVSERLVGGCAVAALLVFVLSSLYLRFTFFKFRFHRYRFEVAGRCLADFHLPAYVYDVARIRTGQLVEDSPLWSGEFPLPAARPLNRNGSS